MAPEIEKVELRSPDVAEDKPRQLFPEVFTESTDEACRPAELDLDRLRVVPGDHVEIAERGQERYGLQWPGKRSNFICLDRALQGDDALKVNRLETFRATEPEIQSRTV